MYHVTKHLEISAAHMLSLDYDSKCENLHGHNWQVDIHLSSEELDPNGMVMDFTHIKREVIGRFDHRCINDVLDANPTAENIARYICELLGPKCWRVDVQESSGNVASYERD